MAYTSEQYKYKLMKLLQRNFRMSNASGRYYTRAFFSKLFEGITVTEESYNAFVRQMEDEMDYCATNGIYACEDLPDSIINEHGLLLVDCFAAIGINLVISTADDTATFTKPDGTVMVYAVTSSKNYFYINARHGFEMDYAKNVMPNFSLEYIDVLGLDECNYNESGPDCYWAYDTDAQTMTITGAGKCEYIPTATEIGAGTFSTVIFGANISGLNLSTINSSACTNVVFLHPEDAELVLSKGLIMTTQTKNIYTNNASVKAYTYPSKWTITFHDLDEWEG